LGGGTIESVSAVSGPHSRPVPVDLSGNQLWPRGHIAAGSKVSIEVVVRRPGWASWLTGKTQRLQLTLRTPTATLRHRYVTLRKHAPLRVGFSQPVSMISYGASAGHLQTRRLADAQSRVTLPKG